MSVFAVDGVAGSGKTYWLMHKLTERLSLLPLKEGQRVLALTFMHGSRRRMAEKLRDVSTICGRFDCITVDSFGKRITSRWASLAKDLNCYPPEEATFDQIALCAKTLLQNEQVISWVCNSYPIVVVDEAQDLTPARLGIISAIGKDATLIIAGDEFQCLDVTLKPNPYYDWTRTVCVPETLKSVRRTKENDLLANALSLRNGMPPSDLKKSKLVYVPSVPLAATYVCNQIAWFEGSGSTAVLTPSLKGGFAIKILTSVSAGPCGKRKNGPYTIHWESKVIDEARELLDCLKISAASHQVAVTQDELSERISTLPASSSLREVTRWIEHQKHTIGKELHTHAEIEVAVRRCLEQRKQHLTPMARRLSAMTIHQAKNREFDGVIVIWPYQVAGNAEQKRRLLYNALTRAKVWSLTLVQGSQPTDDGPFC